MSATLYRFPSKERVRGAWTGVRRRGLELVAGQEKHLVRDTADNLGRASPGPAHAVRAYLERPRSIKKAATVPLPKGRKSK